LCAVITLTLAFVFSRFGFATIVDIFYPIEGIFGGIFIIYAIVFYFKNKKRFIFKKYSLIKGENTGESSELVMTDQKIFYEDKNGEKKQNKNKKIKENIAKSNGNHLNKNDNLKSIAVLKKKSGVEIVKHYKNSKAKIIKLM
jgi:hypothetical protein